MISKAFALVCFASFFSSYAHATLNKPANYTDASGRTIVFVDFTNAVHKITYDVKAAKASYSSEIKFTSDTEGYPVFDAVTSPSKVSVDGVVASQAEVASPDNATHFRVVGTKLAAGEHTLSLEGTITSLVTFDSTSVKSAFWTTDLQDRNYLEKYLPANLEYDQYALELDISVTGTSVQHEIFANGNVTVISPNTFSVVFPATYTTSSHFYHLVPQTSVVTLNKTFTSISLRPVPVIIYKLATDTSVDLAQYMSIVLTNLAELETTYGPFCHDKMIVYATSAQAGMEYSGATMAMQSAVSHEVAHSWFARAAMPANGNAGWLDEAITVWRDNGYPSLNYLGNSSGMAGHGVYNRFTDTNAYGFGADFIAYLNGSLNGIKPFLRNFFEFKKFQPYTTESFAADMSTFTNANATQMFQDHVYKNTMDGNAFGFKEPAFSWRKQIPTSNPMHPHLTEAQLKNLL